MYYIVVNSSELVQTGYSTLMATYEIRLCVCVCVRESERIKYRGQGEVDGSY